MQPVHYHLIGCSVLRDETELLVEQLGVSVTCDWIELGLHDDVPRLNREILTRVEACRGRELDAVLLLYGLCSNGTVGVTAPGVPLVVPRVHDCVSLFLGSADVYRREHEREPGTYWFARGFIHREERARADGTDELIGFTSGEGQEDMTARRRQDLYREFVEKYGEENADFLMETWIDAWKRNYTRAVFVSWSYPGAEGDRVGVQVLAERNGWRYEERPMDFRLLRMLLAGEWPEDAFLVVPPGGRLLASHDRGVLCCGECRGGVC